MLNSLPIPSPKKESEHTQSEIYSIKFIFSFLAVIVTHLTFNWTLILTTYMHPQHNLIEVLLHIVPKWNSQFLAEGRRKEEIFYNRMYMHAHVYSPKIYYPKFLLYNINLFIYTFYFRGKSTFPFIHWRKNISLMPFALAFIFSMS